MKKINLNILDFCKNNKSKKSSLLKLYQKYKECDSGIISTFRSERNYKENMKNFKELKAYLINNYSVVEIRGTFIENYGTENEIEVEEEALIVFDYRNTGKLRKHLLKLGKRYDQDSITFSEKNGKYYLIGTTKYDINYHKDIELNNPMFGENGEFYSKIDGRPFIFKESNFKEESLRGVKSLMATIFYRKVKKRLDKEFLKLSKYSSSNFATVGRFDKFRCKVYAKEGTNIPHFYLEDEKTGRLIAIKIFSPEYFIHGSYTDRLTSKEIKKLIEFLNDKSEMIRKGVFETNYEYLCYLWELETDYTLHNNSSMIPNYKFLNQWKIICRLANFFKIREN